MKKIVVVLSLISLILTGCSNNTRVSTSDNDLIDQISKKEEVIENMQTIINQKDKEIEDLENQLSIKLENIESQYEKEINDLESQHEKDTSDLQSQHSIKIRNLEAEIESLKNIARVESMGLRTFRDYSVNLYGYKDREGNIIIEPVFKNVNEFSEGFAAVKKDDKWIFIDSFGKNVFNSHFDFACNFSEGLASVNVTGEWGYIDKAGTMIIQPQFDTWNEFKNGKAFVKIGGKSGYIDKSGQVTWEENATYSEGVIMPADEANENDSFREFRIEMLSAIKEKDVKFITSHISKNIMYSCDGMYGAEGFINKWGLNENPETSELWTTLEQVLELGSRMYGYDDYIRVNVPYIFASFPVTHSPLEYSVCVDKNVNVYSNPSIDSNVITQLNYNIIKTISDYKIREIHNEGIVWCKIQLPSGERGYVNSKYIRGAYEYRATFIFEDSTWKMAYFFEGYEG